MKKPKLTGGKARHYFQFKTCGDIVLCSLEKTVFYATYYESEGKFLATYSMLTTCRKKNELKIACFELKIALFAALFAHFRKIALLATFKALKSHQ